MKTLLALALLALPSPAHALLEGYYSDRGGHLTSLGVRKINGAYVVRGCANYGGGNSPRLCHVFQATVSQAGWGDSARWEGSGVLTARYHNPSQGTVDCGFEFAIRLYERSLGRELVVQAYTPDTMAYQIVGRNCPTRQRSYSWRTETGFLFL